jgi:hypothetical protein
MMVGINALNVLASALYGLSIVWYRKVPEQNSMPRVTKIG